MKRNVTTIILALLIASTLFGCASKTERFSQSTSPNPQESISQSTTQNNSQESISKAPTIRKTPQVPESVIFLTTDINVDKADRYTVTHNYDADAYIDNVELTLYYEGPYGMDISHNHLWYQYDKTSDLWTLIKQEDSVHEEEINAEAYMDDSPWVGRDSITGCTYSVFFYDIDMEQEIADVAYTITFDGDDGPSYWNSGFFDLEYGYCISLPYETSYDSDSLTLVFDRNVGLREWGKWGYGTASID